MFLNATHEEIARQFINEDRTKIHTPQPYRIWRDAAEDLAQKLIALNTGTASLIAFELLWYRDLFNSWTPQNVTEEERSAKVTEFLLTYQKNMSYFVGVQRGGLR